MNKIRIGVVCPSEIAFRRFLPALQKIREFSYVGVAYADKSEWMGITPTEQMMEVEREKAQKFADRYGGQVFKGYAALLESDVIDAIYIPLPPALHYRWAKKALECGKHTFVEKPSTTSLADTTALVELARKKRLALHENYMFQYHSQIMWIQEKLRDGVIGDIRLIRLGFGFPKRAQGDFRYNKQLGGGALLDCGGYTIRLASMLLGDTAKITAAVLNYVEDCEVDMFGSAMLQNEQGVTAQLAFGMDNSYKCELELWGSKGRIVAPRIFTAPDGFISTVEIKNSKDIVEEYQIEPDDSFAKSIAVFLQAISFGKTREQVNLAIIRQSKFINSFQEMAKL